MSDLTPEQKRELLEEFLERWPVEKVAALTLQEYVDVDNKDTFTYWVETKMRPLGSIKGSFSSKFGIYKRKKPGDKGSDRLGHDDVYSWRKKLGSTSATVFEEVKTHLLQIIAFAETGEFSNIDDIVLQDLFKWKVASLYSNERLVPIFSHDVLIKIAGAYGMTTSKKTKISEIHELLIKSKPAGLDVYSYMESLYGQYGGKGKDHNKNSGKQKHVAHSKKTAKSAATATKNTTPQVRKSARSYIADMKHNKIQQALAQRLKQEHGDEAVLLEENRVDIKLVLPDEIVFYEVKSASYASDCIEEALGQVLGYVFNDTDTRKKRIVVIGQYPPNPDEERFIAFIKSQVGLDFSYDHIDYNADGN